MDNITKEICFSFIPSAVYESNRIADTCVQLLDE